LDLQGGDMFNVEYLHQNIEAITPIISGTTFGYYDLKLVFKVTSKAVPTPLIINFYVSIDEDKSLKFSMGKITNNEVDIKFTLQNNSSGGGLKGPTTLIEIDKKVLAFMFYTEGIPNTNVYKLTYEFYNGKLPPEPTKGALK
jgi:hypothetical protein